MELAVRNSRLTVYLAWIAVGAGFVACQDSAGPGPPGTGEKLYVCHLTPGATTASVQEIYASQLAEHKGHSDYVARLFVDQKNTSTVSDSIHFLRITDAVAAARAVRVARNETTTGSCLITIAVGPGLYWGSVNASTDRSMEKLPIVLDFPSVTLIGALEMPVDGQNRALGASGAQPVTTIVPTPPLQVRSDQVSEPIIVVNAHPDGFQGHGVTITGFMFQSGHVYVDTVPGGQAILALRVHDLLIRGNDFRPLFTESIDLRASSATVERNFLIGTGGSCDICLAGPGAYRATNNRLLAGGISGFLIGPVTLLPVPEMVEQYVLPTTAQVSASVLDNEVRNHLRKPVGVGVRVTAIGLNAPDVVGSVIAPVFYNTLAYNNFAIIVEAGFPVANTTLKGDIDLTLEDNAIAYSCQQTMLVSFSRHITGLGLQNAPYIRNSSYNLRLNYDVYWDEVWYADPDGLGNSLTVNGGPIANGSRAAYDAAKVCPPVG